MKKKKINRWTLIFIILVWFPLSYAWSDGGYFSSKSVVVSTDQRAIIIQNGNEISILGASSASDLINWLQENNYNVNSSALEVLNKYIKKNWAFVAVKLNPGERRNYQNEFLPSLTIMYHYDELIFPLAISSVSTAEEVQITLYIIAGSTVSSSNLPTAALKYDKVQSKAIDPGIYIRKCIVETLGGNGSQGMVVLWSGSLDRSVHLSNPIRELMQNEFPRWRPIFLTRMETRIEPGAMTEDIILKQDIWPHKFNVHIKANGGYFSSLQEAAEADVTLKDRFNRTAYSIAVNRGFPNIADLLREADGSE